MKDKTTAALFALFLGWFGIHRFYLRQPGLGVLYIILMSMGISFILGIIDAIVLLAMDQEEFDRRYNDDYQDAEFDRYRNRRYSRERRDYRRTEEREYAPPRRRSYSNPSTSRSERTPRQPREKERPRPARRKPVERKRVNPYKQSGIKKYKDFDLKAAIEDFEKGLEIEPDDIALHFNIACAYSLTEQADKAFYHLDKAVKNGFKDFKKIKSHDDLAYVRIQPEFEQFEENGFTLDTTPKLEAPKQDLLDDDLLLSQLKRLSELKEKGLITDKEFAIEKQKLMR